MEALVIAVIGDATLPRSIVIYEVEDEFASRSGFCA